MSRWKQLTWPPQSPGQNDGTDHSREGAGEDRSKCNSCDASTQNQNCKSVQGSVDADPQQLKAQGSFRIA